LFVTFNITVISEPVPTDAGDADNEALKIECVCTVTIADWLIPDDTVTDECWSTPLALPDTDTVPVPAAEYVHVNNALAPPAIGADAPGAAISTSPPVEPDVTYILFGSVAFAVAWPTFVTVITIVTVWPMSTVVLPLTLIALVRVAGCSMSTLFDSASMLVTAAPVLASCPVSVPSSPNVPAALAWYTSVYDASAALFANTVCVKGTGPLNNTADPVPIFVKGRFGAVFVASVWPELLTLITTVISCPTEYVPGVMSICGAASTGIVYDVTIADDVFEYTSPVKLHALPLNVIAPAVVALYLHSYTRV
jgi:hypothetical protein